MPLQNSIEAVTENLRSGRYPNEQAISQGVVMRILSELGWDTFNPDQVWPEYSVGGRRVDFALCFPARKPAIFIEVKQPGRVEGGDQQLFEYAFHYGVPMAILCDGKTWGFYLPAEQGNYDERRVYKLDLLERPSKDAADELTRYLSFQRTVSGSAIDDARRDYRDRKRSILARNTIPEAWRDLVEGKEASLVDRLATEVETKCGVKPEAVDIVAFLKTLRAVPNGPTLVPPTGNGDESEVPPNPKYFIVTLDGMASQPLNKRYSILKVVKYLVQNGVPPEKIQPIFDKIDRKTRFESTNGNCNAIDAVEQISKNSSRDILDTPKRYFLGDGEIFYLNGRTYLLSNQWGPETYKTLKALANAFPEHKITIQAASHGD